MALTINTNMSSILAQRSLNDATNSLNTALERMTTGYKINSAADDAAGYSIAKLWETQIGSLDVAADNAATGIDLLTTAEETYSLLTDHLQRVRDLTEQAANGTYGSASLKAIQAEISARLQEINRISANGEFNGIKLMAYNMDGTGNEDVGITESGINLQIGLYADANSVINLDVKLFSNASLSGLFSEMEGETAAGKTLDDLITGVFSNASLSGLFSEMEGETAAGKTLDDLITGAGGSIDALGDIENIEAFAAACSGLVYDPDEDSFVMQTDGELGAKEMLTFLDSAIDEISARVTEIGAVQNRVQSAVTAIEVQSENLTSSLSTLKDADVAEESSNFIQSQILQQASATLLSTANQLPSIALNLI